MAKTWYPVIDYTLCESCGSCVKKCTHGVYNKAKAPVPVVERPDACIDHCHGCGNICPNGAIAYLGEDTGWTPPHGARSTKEADCGCGCGNTSAYTNDSASGCACESNASAIFSMPLHGNGH